MADTVRSLLPAIERTGIATSAEIDVDTLADRLRREAVASGACIVLPPFIGACSRMPAADSQVREG